MDKLKINLIPPEIKEKAKKEAKRSVVIKISIGLLGLLILVTIGILGVIIFQSATITGLNSSIEEEKTKITGLKDKEAVVFFLKNRIDTINKFSDNHYKQGEVYELISQIIPEGIDIASLQVDKSDKVTLSGETTTTLLLDVFFNSLTDSNTNEGKIASVSVDSLSKSANGILRFNLIVNMKEKAQ